MNILIFTPIYYIEGREKLFHDSEAVHYLVKPWATEHQVRVIYLYSQSVKSLLRYLNKEERKYYREGYYYQIDNVNVAMCEVQRIKVRCESKYVTKKLVDFTNKYLLENNFVPDVVVCHIPSQMVRSITKLNFSCRKVAVLHQSDIKLSKQRKSVAKEIEQCFDTIYCRSKTIKDYFTEEAKIQVSDHLINSGIPYMEACNQEDIILQKESNVPIILYVGRLIKRKHVDDIINALALIQDQFNFYFMAIGVGPERKELEKLAEKKLYTRYKFLDYMPRNKVFEEMKNASIFVMPSTEETLGLVYLEAMSQGCICIGTKGEGIDGIIVDGDNGFLVQNQNVIELAETIKKVLMLSMDEKREIRHAALDTSKIYNDKDMAKRYFELITGKQSD